MPTRQTKIAVLLLIGVIAISVGFGLPNACVDFGENLKTAQMERMYGGGFACPDRDCETSGSGCPEHSNCNGRELGGCNSCSGSAGNECGDWQQSWGWMCVDTTQDCGGGQQGYCSMGSCVTGTGGEPPFTTCGTAPDC